MAKPTRKRAKAHTIRKFRALRKKAREDYRQFLLQEYGDASYDPYAL